MTAGATVVTGELVGHTIGTDDELRWLVLPDGTEDVASRWDATGVGIDLVLEDGRTLRALGATDQYGIPIDARDQRDARMLWPEQWNLRRVDLREFVGGRIAEVRILMLGSPRRDVEAFIDGIRLAPRARRDDPLDQVLTTRGTHSSPEFSRGNTVPLVGVPHGTVFGMPMTDASEVAWPYSYAAASADRRPRIQAFATSHISSPWMRDHGVFQLMPSVLAAPDTDRVARASSFDRDHENAGPHRYAVRFDDGMGAELVAAQTVVAARFTYPERRGSLILDHCDHLASARTGRDAGMWTLDAEFSPVGDKPAGFVHVRVDGVVEESAELRAGRLPGYLEVAGPSVGAVIGWSSVSADQARHNALSAGGFTTIRDDAALRWRSTLDTIRIDGASDDQRVSVMSGVYRAALYPTRYDEDTADGGSLSRSPYDGSLVTGPFSASNGFWDTYRTAWPLLALLDPPAASRHAGGFLAHAAAAGWTPRWSAPAAEDCMTGTTFDLVFADLVEKDIEGLDLGAGYRAARRNATVPAEDPRVGRKGLLPALFRGYVSTDTHEGLSWTLDNALNDAGIARIAARLLAQDRVSGRAEDQDLRAEADYFARRALGYRAVFDGERGFFVGRDADGTWRDGFDPREWGHDYTETTGWGTAFTAPHDGAGLAELHGGEDALGRALDAMLVIDETAHESLRGHYPTVIHEMREARDTRSGMLALSNQPAHHIPFMYMFAGRHDDAHRLVTDARRRLFVGSDFGQGYPGDEDNGEMSAWYVFVTIGLYPLVPASGSYVLVPPAVDCTRLFPVGGRPIEIVVRSGRAGDPYIRDVRVDGRPWGSISIPHSRLAAGCTIEFDLSPVPCGWAASSRPPSFSGGAGPREPLVDLCLVRGAAGAIGGAARLVDDEGTSPVQFGEADAVRLAFSAPAVVSIVAVTAARAGRISARVELLGADGTALAVRELDDEEFPHDRQTRIFAAPVDAGRRLAYGMSLTARSPMSLLQVQAFAEDTAPSDVDGRDVEGAA